jgi:phosphatidylglycerophosphate synthase
MLDAKLRPLIDPPLNRAGAWIHARGLSANAVTLAGMAAGLGAAVAIWQGAFGWALGLVLLSRLLDGLDGAVARAGGGTAFGAYFDIVADFVFYLAVPLAFGLATPANLGPALVLLAAFGLTGVSFLAFAAVAAGRGLETTAHGKKGFFYSTGLAEGAETILFFVLVCAFPAAFPMAALAFAGLCGLTVGQRSWLAWRQFGGGG